VPLLLLLLLLAAAGGVGAQDAALRFIDDFSGMAKCLDGSSMGTNECECE
jgi:hypothetical protein